MRTVTDDIAAVLDAPDTSPWLREALLAALQRDPVAAADDAQRLAQLLTSRVEAMVFLEQWRQPCDLAPLLSLDRSDSYGS